METGQSSLYWIDFFRVGNVYVGKAIHGTMWLAIAFASWATASLSATLSFPIRTSHSCHVALLMPLGSRPG